MKSYQDIPKPIIFLLNRFIYYSHLTTLYLAKKIHERDKLSHLIFLEDLLGFPELPKNIEIWKPHRVPQILCRVEFSITIFEMLVTATNALVICSVSYKNTIFRAFFCHFNVVAWAHVLKKFISKVKFLVSTVLERN